MVWNVKVVEKNKYDRRATEQVNPDVPSAEAHRSNLTM
jgi:hypothetical protein